MCPNLGKKFFMTFSDLVNIPAKQGSFSQFSEQDHDGCRSEPTYPNSCVQEFGIWLQSLEFFHHALLEEE
jgi:hypothetical protein